MNCKDVVGCISEYVDGLLSMSKVRDIEAHFAECSECRNELKSTQEMIASLSSLSGQKSPVDCWDSVRASIQPMRQRKPVWWRRALRPVFAVPAAGLVAILVIFLAWPTGNTPVVSDKAYASEYNYYIGAHSRLQRQQAFVDPDVVYMRAELQKASLATSAE